MTRFVEMTVMIELKAEMVVIESVETPVMIKLMEEMKRILS